METHQIKKLLERISRKDEEAFNVLFNFYYPKLIQIALSFVPGIIAAQEVVSDLFYKILKSPNLLVNIDNFDNYIFLAVKNQAYTYLQKNKDKAYLHSIDNEDYILPDPKNPENSLLSDELYHLVDKAIQSLPPKRKTIFLLVKEEGKKYREVAEILGISIKTVELQMFYALKVLRKAVREYMDSKDVKIKPISKLGLLSIFF